MKLGTYDTVTYICCTLFSFFFPLFMSISCSILSACFPWLRLLVSLHLMRHHYCFRNCYYHYNHPICFLYIFYFWFEVSPQSFLLIHLYSLVLCWAIPYCNTLHSYHISSHRTLLSDTLTRIKEALVDQKPENISDCIQWARWIFDFVFDTFND